MDKLIIDLHALKQKLETQNCWWMVEMINEQIMIAMNAKTQKEKAKCIQ